MTNPNKMETNREKYLMCGDAKMKQTSKNAGFPLNQGPTTVVQVFIRFSPSLSLSLPIRHTHTHTHTQTHTSDEIMILGPIEFAVFWM